MTTAMKEFVEKYNRYIELKKKNSTPTMITREYNVNPSQERKLNDILKSEFNFPNGYRAFEYSLMSSFQSYVNQIKANIHVTYKKTTYWEEIKRTKDRYDVRVKYIVNVRFLGKQKDFEMNKMLFDVNPNSINHVKNSISNIDVRSVLSDLIKSATYLSPTVSNLSRSEKEHYKQEEEKALKKLEDIIEVLGSVYSYLYWDTQASKNSKFPYSGPNLEYAPKLDYIHF